MIAQHLADYLEASAQRYPNRLAVVDSSGQTITYEDLNRRADGLAAFLVDRGVRRGDRVGVLLPKSIPSVVALFGAMKAGGVYVPVDYSAPAARSRQILVDCRVRALVIDSRSVDAILSVDPPTLDLAALITVGPSAEPAAPRSTSLDTAIDTGGAPTGLTRDVGDLAYIIYTSGSTGTPKGAKITHRNAMIFLDWCSSVLKPTEDDRFGSHTPFHFDASVQDIYPAIRHGAALHLISEELAKKPRELVEFIGQRQLTIWSSTPSALIMLLQFGNLEARTAQSLRLVSFGGEVFPVKHLRELQRLWPSVVYYNMYGPTETTTTCTFARIPPVIPPERETPYPIGFPCSHCRAVVLDDDRHPVPPGDQGLLHISGPSVFDGYWNRPQESADVLFELDGVRWYNTGDVVRWDPADGFTYVGRRDRMVKRRGYRVELGEIERALYLHPRVSEAAVIALADADAGFKIVAMVSCEGSQPSIVDLKTFLATKIPTYMSPDVFLFRDSFPKTSTGKIDYQTLKAELSPPSARTEYNHASHV